MEVKGIVQGKDGRYEVTVELNSDQHKFIFEAGLGFLLSTGALPLTMVAREEAKLVDVVIDEDEKEPTIN